MERGVECFSSAYLVDGDQQRINLMFYSLNEGWSLLYKWCTDVNPRCEIAVEVYGYKVHHNRLSVKIFYVEVRPGQLQIDFISHIPSPSADIF